MGPQHQKAVGAGEADLGVSEEELVKPPGDSCRVGEPLRKAEHGETHSSSCKWRWVRRRSGGWGQPEREGPER